MCNLGEKLIYILVRGGDEQTPGAGSRDRLKFCTVGRIFVGSQYGTPFRITLLAPNIFMWFQIFETFLRPFLCKLSHGADIVSDYIR
jgi:hypothetical protein